MALLFNSWKGKILDLDRALQEEEIWVEGQGPSLKSLQLLDDFCCACKRGDFFAVRKFIEELGVPLNVRDKWDATPLYYCCLCGHYSLVKYLLAKGAKCEEGTFEGERCLYAAHNSEIRNLLREYKMVIKRDPFRDFLKRCFNEGNFSPFTDICFLIRGEKIFAHRVILQIRSSWFANMLATKWKDKKEVTLKHKLMDPIAFKAILGYLYVGSLEISFKHSYICLLLCKQCKLTSLMKLLEIQRNKMEVGDITSELILINLDRSCEVLEIEIQNDFKKLHQTITAQNPYEDIIFNVDSVAFHCHKIFFIERSEYFKAMLTGYFQEAAFKFSELPEISLSSLSLPIFMNLTQYMYTGDLEIILDPSLLFEMLAIADQFLLYNLKSKVEKQLCTSINLTDLWDFFAAAKLYSLSKLESFCVEFIAKHLEKIVQMEEFRKYVEQDAFSIQERQATDSIPLIDEIRTQLHKIYGEDETLILTQDFISLDRKRVKFQVLEKFLLDIGIDG